MMFCATLQKSTFKTGFLHKRFVFIKILLTYLLRVAIIQLWKTETQLQVMSGGTV